VLSEALKSIKGIDSEIVCGNSRIRLSEIIQEAQSVKNKAPTTVALAIENPVKLIMHLIGFDGFAQTIVLISPDSSPEDLQRQMQFFENCKMITDNDTTIDTSQGSTGEGFPNQCHDTKWVLATSGTTAVPKQVAHTFQSLTRTTSFGTGSAYRWGVLYDPYRFAGLQVILQGLLGGSSIVFPKLQQTMQDQVSFLVNENVNALSATPTLWRKILMCDNSKNLDLRTISLGGEIVDGVILRALSSAYPNASIRHIYASTEAGTGFSVGDGNAGFPISFLTEPPDGIVLKIRNQTLHVKNPDVNSHYINASDSFADEEGFLDTGDLVIVKGDRVYFQGRLNGIINVGGNKVFPERVESILLKAGNVSFARAYGQPNPIIGQLVVADIVALDKTDIEQTRIELNQKAFEELEAFERPTHYNFVDSVAHTPNGKVLRA